VGGDFLKKSRLSILVIGVLACLCGCNSNVLDGTYASGTQINFDETFETSAQNIEVKKEKSTDNQTTSKEDFSDDTEETYSIGNLPDYSGTAWVGCLT
jgi:hypothetical protein